MILYFVKVWVGGCEGLRERVRESLCVCVCVCVGGWVGGRVRVWMVGVMEWASSPR